LESEAVGDDLTELLVIGFNVESKKLSVGVLDTLVVGCNELIGLAIVAVGINVATGTQVGFTAWDSLEMCVLG